MRLDDEVLSWRVGLKEGVDLRIGEEIKVRRDGEKGRS
jgi:hypothetical protein